MHNLVWMMESSAARLLLSTSVLGSVRLPAITLGRIGKYFTCRFQCLVADQSRGGVGAAPLGCGKQSKLRLQTSPLKCGFRTTCCVCTDAGRRWSAEGVHARMPLSLCTCGAEVLRHHSRSSVLGLQLCLLWSCLRTVFDPVYLRLCRLWRRAAAPTSSSPHQLHLQPHPVGIFQPRSWQTFLTHTSSLPLAFFISNNVVFRSPHRSVLLLHRCFIREPHTRRRQNIHLCKLLAAKTW